MFNTMNEISRLSINISKFDEATLNHHNSLTALRADKYLHILEYSCNLQCLDKKLDFIESSIPCPKSCASSDIITDGLKENIKNNDLNEMITNPYLWPFSSYLKDEMVNISSYEWSPSNFIYNNQCVLTILNNVGNVEFYVPHCKQWESILDFSSIIRQYLSSESLVPLAVRKNTSLYKLKEIVYKISTSASCWAPQLNNDQSCYFVTAQKNGFIYFWHLKFEDTNLNVKNIGKFETDEVEITSLAWIPSSNDTFLFLYTNMFGQIIAKVCKIELGKLCEISSSVIWKYKDRMIPKYVKYIHIKNRIIVTYSKHRHYIVQMFDENCNFISESIKNINDERITALAKFNNDIYIGTINIKIYKVNFIITDNNIGVNLEQVHLKDSYANHELYGMAFSENGVLCTLVIIDRSVSCRKVQQKLFTIWLKVEDSEPEDILFNSPSHGINKMWDCIELIRYKAVKTKQLPIIDYAELYKAGESNVNQMKIYLTLLKIYLNLESVHKNLSHGMLPETSIDVVRHKILAVNASRSLTEIYEKVKTNTGLNAEELDSLYGCKMFLSYISKKYNKILLPNVLEKIDSYFEEVKLENKVCICQWCDDVLEGFSCKNGHINMICILTFNPINSLDYLICRVCNVTAKMELKDSQPQCPFCDSYLDCHSVLY